MTIFMQFKKTLALLALMTTALVACGPSAPLTQTSTGKTIEGDKAIAGKVTGSKVGSSTKIAVFGAFSNISGNKIDAENQTIENDITLVVAPVKDGVYNFALPKAPQKAQGAILKIFAFNDANGNSVYDDSEIKSKEATMTFAVGIGYTGAEDADGNKVVIDPLSSFKDFNFKLD
jgi:hypothetical protein